MTRDELATLLTLQMNQVTELLDKQAYNKYTDRAQATLFQTLLAIRKNSIELEKLVRYKS